ncbi:hypothetical protein K435DRAFT_134890 [Dendrothele bispora CBS 962.96]|uniref:Uncharacterized protein n=1 Tax=Dendrothele bispora (strain CBS 962.96) TaxID=1314807 RepID=A0A4S8MQ82_DENBC|nr:hypothetical protein K435DRAFT_134890 [Dendrothele bispora CBS 962.96]
MRWFSRSQCHARSLKSQTSGPCPSLIWNPSSTRALSIQTHGPWRKSDYLPSLHQPSRPRLLSFQILHLTPTRRKSSTIGDDSYDASISNELHRLTAEKGSARAIVGAEQAAGAVHLNLSPRSDKDLRIVYL